MTDYIFKSSWQYLGFIKNGNIFSWNGQYLGWIESGYVWDVSGQFKGEIKEINGHSYILRNMYVLPPLPKTPKGHASDEPLPAVPPQMNITPISSPEIGWVDGF